MDTPSFFLSAWNSDYIRRYHQGQVENNQLDYFSYQPAYQARHLSGLFQLRNCSDQTVEALNLSLFDEGATTAEPKPAPEVFNQIAPMQDTVTCASPSAFGITGLEIHQLDERSPKTNTESTPLRLVIEFVKNTGRRTSLHNGQVTPAASPLGESLLVEEEGAKVPTPKSERDDCCTIADKAPKVKKLRKRSKMENNEQEEVKRKKFLERNRIAANKCRQTRKKWIDDLQTKVHLLRADNIAKKAACEDLEQEIPQLRSSLFIHSKSCTNMDTVAWTESETDRIQLIGRAQSKQPGDGILLDLSTPLSTYNDGMYNDGMDNAVSQRFSEMIKAEDLNRRCGSNELKQGCYARWLRRIYLTMSL
jgi:hypothetical protein